MLSARLALATWNINWTVLKCKRLRGYSSLVFNFSSQGQVKGPNHMLATIQKNPGESERFYKSNFLKKKACCVKFLEQNTYVRNFLSSSVSIWQYRVWRALGGLSATDITPLLPSSSAKFGKLIFRNNKLGRASLLSKDWSAELIFLSLI